LSLPSLGFRASSIFDLREIFNSAVFEKALNCGIREGAVRFIGALRCGHHITALKTSLAGAGGKILGGVADRFGNLFGV
jgi:hypothetical protein